MNLKVAVLIPTYNACKKWEQVLQQISLQSQKIERLIVLDSGSTDRTVELAIRYGAEVYYISKQDFTHGYARHKMVSMCPEADIYVLMTQDATLTSPDSLANLVRAFDDPLVGVAYGRHVPYEDAGIIEAHNRNYNYPEKSVKRSIKDVDKHGFRTIFCLNSFAAYRKTAYEQAGGFPVNTNFGEDSLLCARMILDNWHTAYVANAAIYHSHNDGLAQEFNRFYAIGKFHKENTWLYDLFGKPGGEGFKYVLSQISYILKRNPFLLFSVGIRLVNKFIAYKLGWYKTKPVARLQPIQEAPVA